MDVAKLDGLPLFEGLSRQHRELIAQNAVEVDLPEGKVLVHDGAVAWDFYVIEEGSAEVRRGQTTKFGTLGAGDFFGEIGVMASDQRRTASVVTTSPMRAIRLTTHQLRLIVDEVPEFAERLRAVIAEREQHLL
jgi:CRP/FNR family transcriptional regulator, cyclic AMP receptor protein